MLSASVGDPLRISLAEPAGPSDPGAASIALLQEPAPPAPSDRRRAAGSADPFAPPPDSEASPLLAHDLDRSLALRPSPDRRPPSELRQEPREIVVEESARPGAAARGKKTMAPERLLSSRARSHLVKALSLLALAVGARVAYSYLRPVADGGPTVHGAICKVRLTVEPSQASVQIDHAPTAQRELSLDSGVPHVLNAASPGRVTKRFAFDVKPDLELSVHLGHALPLPSPTDPPPLPAELAADYPDEPRPQVDIERAFAKLDRYADCLARAGDAGGEGRGGESRKGAVRGRLRGEELALCQRLVAEAGTAEPALPEVQTAAESYLSAAQSGQKLDALGRLAATFRAEFLTARTAWQLEELSRQGKDEGQKAAWHMRRVALAAQAWVRAVKTQGPFSDERAAKLREVHQALLDYAQGAGQEMARIAGGIDFLQSAEGVLALTRGKKPSEFAALDAGRRLLSAFGALVLE
jgi:hypothetical protein